MTLDRDDLTLRGRGNRGPSSLGFPLPSHSASTLQSHRARDRPCRLQKDRHMTNRIKIGTALAIAISLTLPIGRVTASPEVVPILVAKRDHSRYDGILPDRYYDLLSICETGQDWNHSTRSYTGGLGIARGTWQRWSNSSSAKGKTPQYQVKVADKIAFLGHNERGEWVFPVGPYGWGCVKHSETLQGFICRSKDKVVKRWKRYC